MDTASLLAVLLGVGLMALALWIVLRREPRRTTVILRRVDDGDSRKKEAEQAVRVVLLAYFLDWFWS